MVSPLDIAASPELAALRTSFVAHPVQHASRSQYSVFRKPAPADGSLPIVVTRLPRPRPAGGDAPASDDGRTLPAALAYAAATDTVDAPFDTLINDRQGTMTREQHGWMRNPQPASVHDAAEQKCLAEGIYFEARGETEDGQAAVAQVILNRVRNPAYPDTICKVVYQNESWRNRCQFSFACDGIAERIRSRRAWRIARRIAAEVTAGKLRIASVGDATHYHAAYVRPGWHNEMIRMDRIGEHIFYRTRFGGWS